MSRRNNHYPCKQKSRLPFQVNGLTFGEELGTRTPDPLRVMHDDFSIFRTMIRQMDLICYRSATNDDLETQLVFLFLRNTFENQIFRSTSTTLRILESKFLLSLYSLGVFATVNIYRES